LSNAVDQLQRCCGDTRIVTAVNGIPYWYFYRTAARWRQCGESVDPGGRSGEDWQPDGHRCIVYPATEIVEPRCDPSHLGTSFLS